MQSGNTGGRSGRDDNFTVMSPLFYFILIKHSRSNIVQSSNTGSGGSDSYDSGNAGSGDYTDNSDSYGSRGTGTNTTSSKKGDSTAGKLMEKAGGVFKNEGLVEKGQQKRAQAGNDDFSSNLGSNNDNY